MKSRNLGLTGPHYTYINGALTNTATGSMWSYVVTPGSMIQGNHKDPNSWSYDVVSIRFPTIQYRKEFPTWGEFQKHVWFFSNADSPAGPAWDRTRVYNAALGRLNDKVRGGLDLAVSIAEISQLRKQLLDTIRKLIALGKNGGLKGWGSTRDLANGWLEWQYGWKPLMSDIYGIIDELFRLHITTLKTVHASANQPLTGLGVIPRFIGEFTWQVRSSGEGKESCRFVMTVEIPGGTLDRWSTLNPVGLAWELIPFSFVVDWFFDVGSYMKNLETALLYSTRFKSGYVSELYWYDGIEESLPGQKFSFPTANPPKYCYNDFTKSKIRIRRFRRTKLTSYPLPRPPSFKADLGTQQLLSLASLLRQFLS